MVQQVDAAALAQLAGRARVAVQAAANGNRPETRRQAVLRNRNPLSLSPHRPRPCRKLWLSTKLPCRSDQAWLNLAASDGAKCTILSCPTRFSRPREVRSSCPRRITMPRTFNLKEASMLARTAGSTRPRRIIPSWGPSWFDVPASIRHLYGALSIAIEGPKQFRAEFAIVES